MNQHPQRKNVADQSPSEMACHFLSRREAVQSLAVGFAMLANTTLLRAREPAEDNAQLRDRVEGLLIGSFLGDALGGPIEFQEPKKVQALHHPPKKWDKNDVLDQAALRAAAKRLELKSYRDLRPVPEPYGQWTHNAEPGTVTDDSRHKMILLAALRDAEKSDSWPLSDRDLARAYLEWPQKWAAESHSEYNELCDQWLEEIQFSALWILGERDLTRALPPGRLWVGLTTCCGQMTLPPLAAIYPGQPELAYLAGYSLDFIDNGFGRDMNSALLAGLATALTIEVDHHDHRAAWKQIITSMRNTDPFRYQQVPWSQRSVDRWLDFALNAARSSQKHPARCFEQLDAEFFDTTKWEAHVPFVVMFAALELCDYDPLGAMQLSIEWGHDTDSYAQLLGAFVGATYGAAIFPSSMRTTVAERLQLDYQESLEEWVDLLLRIRTQATNHTLFQLPSSHSE